MIEPIHSQNFQSRLLVPQVFDAGCNDRNVKTKCSRIGQCRQHETSRSKTHKARLLASFETSSSKSTTMAPR